MVRTVAFIWQSAIAAFVLTVPATIVALDPQARSRQPSDILATISAGAGGAPRLAVLDFIAQPADAETVAVARMIRQVLVDDLTFEREFALMPSDSSATIPAPGSFDDLPLDRWRGLKADGVLTGTVQKRAADLHVEVRLVLGEEPRYAGSAAAHHRTPPRLHFVRGHMVHRSGKTFWRASHLRGDTSKAVLQKTVRVTAAKSARR